MEILKKILVAIITGSSESWSDEEPKALEAFVQLAMLRFNT